MVWNVPDQNSYDPATKNQQPETQPIDVIIANAVKSALRDARVCIPAKITAVHGNQKVDVQFLFQSRYVSDNSVITIPPAQNVMVSMPMGQNWRIKLPIAVGDTGWCIFSDRSLDIWSAGDGDIVDPQDSRAHDLSDPIFIPGLVPFSEQSEDAAEDMLLVNGDAQAVLKPDGKFEFTNGQNELIDLLSQLVDTLANQTFTNTLLGPQPFIAATVQLLTELKTKIDTLKG